MVAGVNQYLSVEMADGRLVIHHENAMGRTRLASKSCALQPARLPDFVIFHGMIITCTTLRVLWGVHPIRDFCEAKCFLRGIPRNYYFIVH
jgi:hypothetical protein